MGKKIESDYSEFRVWLTPEQMKSLQEQIKLKEDILRAAESLYAENPSYYANYKRTVALLYKKCDSLLDPHNIKYHCFRSFAGTTTAKKWAAAKRGAKSTIDYFSTSLCPIVMRRLTLTIPAIGGLMCNRRHPTGKGYYISAARLRIDETPFGTAIYAIVSYRPKDANGQKQNPQGDDDGSDDGSEDDQ